MTFAYASDRDDPLPGYRAAVVTALEIGTGVTVYNGDVPQEIELDEGGYPRPYVVLFSGDGDDLPETDLSGRLDEGSLRWDFQTTSVGATPEICARVAGTVRRVLTNMPLGTYHVLPSPNGMGGSVPVKDTTVKPTCYMLPRMWRLDTTY